MQKYFQIEEEENKQILDVINKQIIQTINFSQFIVLED